MFSGKTQIIAEVGLAHDGSLGAAHAFIDAIAGVGVETIKFQVHIAEAESSKSEEFRIRPSSQDATRFDYWKRTGFSLEQWRELKLHCETVGTEFLATPFSLSAFEMLVDLGCDSIKIGSGDFTNPEMLERLESFNGRAYMSTGLAFQEEVDSVVSRLHKSLDLVLMQCTSAYPTPPTWTNFEIMEFWRRKYKIPVGYSDHSGQIHSGLHAISLGADVLEIHACFSKKDFGLDVSSSLTIEEIEMLVNHSKRVAEFRETLTKNEVAGELKAIRNLFGRSLGLTRDLNQGEQVKLGDFTLRKPAGGLTWERRFDLVGKRAVRQLSQLELVTDESFE
jgi:N,N'-diacetyllegionaminate synthase